MVKLLFSDSDHKMDASTYSLRPITRVPPGISLLQNPTELKLEAIDSLELARQWTLIDHALFCSIPLYSLLGNGDRSDSYTAPRFRQLKVGQVRRFIDRFNATSMWVTRTILQCNTPHEKAQIISKFIQVMSHLADLYNFNGVMAVLTALQQGCIARLKISFDLVSRSEKAKLEKLQVRIRWQTGE